MALGFNLILFAQAKASERVAMERELAVDAQDLAARYGQQVAPLTGISTHPRRDLLR